MKYGLATLTCFCAISMAFGQDFYNGDMGGDSGSANTIGGTRAFDEVRVVNNHVSLIWANMGQFGDNLNSISSYEYQFRTGMGFQNAGTLVASGVVTGFVKTATGREVSPGTPEYQIALPVSLALQPGIYFMSIAAVAPAASNVFVIGTDGSDLGPDSDPNPAPVNQLLNGQRWDLFNSGNGGADPANGDLSYGVRSDAVPEPATLTALGLGALAFLRRRKVRD